MIIYGIHPVREALRAGRAASVGVSRHPDPRLDEILRLAAKRRVPIERLDAADLDRATGGAAHQGVMARLDQAPEPALEDLVAAATGPALLVVLDGVEDPQNLGAILRVADAAGVHGLVRQARHAAPLGGAAAKASAGAVAHVKVATVVNIARAVEELKELQVWTVGFASDAPRTLYDVDFTLPAAVVLGAEGSGLRRLVRERCDLLASIPMAGHIGSLNVATAAAVVLYEAVRQRQGHRPRKG